MNVALSNLTKNSQGNFLWPGYGENSRVLDWILRRCDDEPCYTETALGNVPAENALNVENLGDLDLKSLFSIPKEFWLKEVSISDIYTPGGRGDLGHVKFTYL